MDEIFFGMELNPKTLNPKDLFGFPVKVYHPSHEYLDICMEY